MKHHNISTQDPTDEEERELMDPDTWDWESAEFMEGGRHAGVGLHIVVSRDLFPDLAELATLHRVTPAEMVQRIVTERLAGDEASKATALRKLAESA